jgi:hypothetical protein
MGFFVCYVLRLATRASRFTIKKVRGNEVSEMKGEKVAAFNYVPRAPDER